MRIPFYHQNPNYNPKNSSSSAKNPEAPFVDVDAEKAKKKVFKWLPIVLILLVLLMLSNNIFVVTHPNEYTMIRQFGKVVDVKDEPGLSLKIPVIQTATPLPNTVCEKK